MCWESFDVVRFDLGALVQGQMTIPKLKSAYISLIIGPSSIMFFTYFLHSYNMVSSLLLNVQVSNGYFIATFSENVKNHKYLENRKR